MDSRNCERHHGGEDMQANWSNFVFLLVECRDARSESSRVSSAQTKGSVLARVAGLLRAPRLLCAPCLDQRWLARVLASNPLDPGFGDGSARPSAGFRAYASRSSVLFGPER